MTGRAAAVLCTGVSESGRFLREKIRRMGGGEHPGALGGFGNGNRAGEKARLRPEGHIIK